MAQKKKYQSKKNPPKMSKQTRVLISERDKVVHKNKILREQIQKYRIYYGNLKGNKSFIKRRIEFAPEHKQAGISILSYFGRVVEQRYPMRDATVKIEQDQFIVRLVVETNKGDRECIEKTLDDYGLVVTGQMDLADFYSNPEHVLELKQKLRMAHLEIKHTEEIMELSKSNYEKVIRAQEGRISNLESHVEKLMKTVSDSITSTHQQQDKIISINAY